MNKFINQEVEKIYDEIVKLRREFHENPELSDFEYETQNRIIRELEKENIEYVKVAKTGVYAIIQNGNSDKVCALRADIDALPILENSGVPFTSKNLGVMHACGHDVHSSVQLGVAKILKRNLDKWNGTVKMFFQPAEETTGGAERMLKEGVNKDIKAKRFFSFHVAPEIEVNKIGVRYGALHACSATFKYTIKGNSSHAALPHLGIDAILIGTKVVDFLQTIVSRNVDPRDSVVITVGTFNGGRAVNIVADTVELTGTMRFLSDKKRDEIIFLIRERLPKLVESYGGNIEMNISKGYMPVINDDAITKFVLENAKDILGESNVEIINESRMDAEDVGYFINEIPGTYYRVGIRNEKIGCIYDLHHEKFKVDENAIKIGMKMQLKNILEYFKEDNE